jgi:adenylate cyclase
MGRTTQTMAVVFADISESTSLYQKLGDTTAQNIVNACVTVISEVLSQFNGRLVKTIGDEVMCVFPTADLGLLATMEMQKRVSENRPGNHQIAIHIGLHYGRVLVEDNDVFGDTVNVAAYLAAAATAEQVLTTHATEQSLSVPLKSSVRPIFQTVLKGASEETMIYQVLWRTDNLGLTDVNLRSRKSIPGDTGSLVVALGDQSVRVDQWRIGVLVGRAKECDLVVTDNYASRKHFTIKLVRTQFYLYDHSINGTFVSPESGGEVHVLRRELVLDGSGRICLGHSRDEQPSEIVTYSRDRRSIYRV